MQISNHLTFSNTSALSEGLKLLNLLTEDQYKATYQPVFQSTIGAHFRHVLEHYQCFFQQLELQHFCYDSRQRNIELETDIHFAKEVLVEQQNEMLALDVSFFSKSYTLYDQSIDNQIETNLTRELLFLQSHTTHHFAIIAAISRALGVQPHSDFGVAIATRNHQQMLHEMENVKCAP